MAVDEVLLESAVNSEVCTSRWYRWSQATVSLGYFQDAAEARADPRLSSLPIVRRLSGGGAILHHHELTYSCAVGATHPLAAEPSLLYDCVHSAIIAVLAGLGLPARLRGERLAEREALFLCFGRGDPRDVVVHGQKILGSAQRRRRGAVIQHGALLMRRSQYAPEFPGLYDLSSAAIDAESLQRELAQAVAQALGPESVSAALSEAETHRADELERERYSSPDWSRKRPAPVD
jgi:lipoate-protein ligase A